MIDLTTYPAVKTSLFVRIQIDKYATSPTGNFVEEVITISDHDTAFTINQEQYTNLGKLLGVSPSRNELRPSSSQVSISISGIPNSAIAEIVNSRIKGAPVRIYRGFFDVSTGNLIGDIFGRFRGFVNNYGLEEEYDVRDRASSNIIQLECSSSVDVLNNKFSGRKTNPQSMKKYFPNDTSMDRVPNLENTTFDFGKPKE